MHDIISSGKFSPFDLLKEILKISNKEKQEILKQKSKDYQKVIQQVAFLVRQFWKIRISTNLLITQLQNNEEQKRAVEIYQRNFMDMVARMNISVMVVKQGEIDEETEKLFDVITIIPSNKVKTITVDKMIEPAVLWNNNIILKGAIQILKPEDDFSESTRQGNEVEKFGENKAHVIVSEAYKDWLEKGVVMFTSGRFAEAIDCFDKAISIEAKLVQAWHEKGKTLEYLGKYEEAVTCYNKALELDENISEIWNRKGSVLLKSNRHEEAIQCLQKAYELGDISLETTLQDLKAKK